MVIFYLMAVVSLSVVVTGYLQGNIQCFINGTMVMKNPNATRFQHFHLSFSTANANCTGEFSDGFMNLVLKNCKMNERIEVLFVGDNSLVIKKDNFAGPYGITCLCVPLEGISLTIGVGIVVEDNSSIPTEIKSISGALIVTKLGGSKSYQTAKVDKNDSVVQWSFNKSDFLNLLSWGETHSSDRSTVHNSEESSYVTKPTLGIVANTTIVNTDENASVTQTETKEIISESTEQSVTINHELYDIRTTLDSVEETSDTIEERTEPDVDNDNEQTMSG